MNKPLDIKLGPCPDCGSVASVEWVHGHHGWICESFAFNVGLKTDGQPMRTEQSKQCYAMHWQKRAEQAEQKLAAIRKLTDENTST